SPTGGAAMIRLGAAVVILGLAAGGAWGSSPDPKDQAIPAAELGKARELVRRLGSDDPREREAAQAELARMGRLARPVLADAGGATGQAEVEAGKAVADRPMAIYLHLHPSALGRVPPGPPVPPPQAPSVADVAALMFAEVVVDGRYIPRAGFFTQISAAAFL